MPITAKLSNKFYEKLGDEVVNELVEWLNLVDTSYRQEFKDLFDANFRRLESEMAGLREHVEARMAGLQSEMAGVREHVGARLQTMDARIAGMEGVVSARLLGLDGRIVELQGRLLAEMDAKLGGMQVQIGKQKWSLLTWTILMWLGTLGFMAAMLKR